MQQDYWPSLRHSQMTALGLCNLMPLWLMIKREKERVGFNDGRDIM
jgi:hypothetical protein